ncbi:exo-beta-N-acetylmuramidase NamZ family protein [Nitrospina sp. 32_T5]|uniref:exo-beta-N-acetylmuramidase NamZ family protein n=1 Tax=unclassified Nitrospina TaxID=2638683 RepID=UPI003F9C82CF
MTHVKTGLDRLLADPAHILKGRRVGLVANHTCVAADGRYGWLHFQEHDEIELVKLLAPEHGLYGVAQDMESVDSSVDPGTGLAIHSLYGTDEASLRPSPELFADLDTVVFDIQDIGSRYYTFVYTMAFCMEACREAGVRMVVCDRPNPINGHQVEGNCVGEGYRSFVGQYPILNRHGMTAGELACLFNEHFGIGCDLGVVHMEGWNRNMWYDETGLPWVAPSPNMPTVSTATVYPGMCLLEATQLSEGRGTTLPFEQCGAPGIDAYRLAERLNRKNLPGVQFRPQYFKPGFQKHRGELCAGVFLQVTHRERFKPLITGIAVLRAISQDFPDRFSWRDKPYEFITDIPAIDLLYGNPELREHLLGANFSLLDIEQSWEPDTQAFLPLRREYLMY